MKASTAQLDSPAKRLDDQVATPLHVLAWACFLGCSWTWVIGMLLPILLVRDFGLEHARKGPRIAIIAVESVLSSCLGLGISVVSRAAEIR